MSTRGVLRAVVPVATVLALGLAAWEWYSGRSDRALLRDVAGAVSTQYVGQFPGNMQSINELLQRAVDATRDNEVPDGLGVLIATDHLIYGFVSSHREFRRYIEHIKTLLERGVEVNIVCYDTQRGKTDATAQLRQDYACIDSLMKTKAYGAFRREWNPTNEEAARLARCERIEGGASIDSFVALLFESVERRYIKECGRANLTTIGIDDGEDLPYYLWSSDVSGPEELIVSFESHADPSKEVTLSSREPKVIEALRSHMIDYRDRVQARKAERLRKDERLGIGSGQ